MHFKLIIAFIADNKVDIVLNAAREVGAMGATVINHARGEGIEPTKTFFGLQLETHRNVLLLLVEEHLARTILEKISEVGGFETDMGAGIAFQLDVEDAVGVAHQVQKLTGLVEENL